MTEERLDPLLVNIRGAAAALGCGRSLVYRLLASGELDSLNVGGLRRIPVAELHAFVDRQTGARPIDRPSPDDKMGGHRSREQR